MRMRKRREDDDSRWLKKFGGLLLFGSGVVVGAASNEMIINDANNRELNNIFRDFGRAIHKLGMRPMQHCMEPQT